MTLRFSSNMKKIFAGAALVACLGAFTIVSAQIDPFSYELVQNGVQVGIIYVPDRAPGTMLYAEHWILFPNYVYPGARNHIVTEIVPAERQFYTSEADFFRRAPWGTGFRYVHVASTDTTMLPGR